LEDCSSTILFSSSVKKIEKELMLNLFDPEQKNSKIIVCYEGGDPEIEINYEIFFNNPKLFLSRPENWVISKEHNWIIEYIYDQKEIRLFVKNKNEYRLEKIIQIQ